MKLRLRTAYLAAGQSLAINDCLALSVMADDSTNAEALTDYLLENREGENIRMRSTYNLSAGVIDYVKVTANLPTKVIYFEASYLIL